MGGRESSGALSPISGTVMNFLPASHYVGSSILQLCSNRRGMMAARSHSPRLID